MNYFFLAVLLGHFIPVIALDKTENGDKEVDVIYFPYEIGGDNNNSAVLSVDLKDLNNFTVCFAFMVDGMVDVADNADTATFWYMMAAFSTKVNFDSLLIEEGTFAPLQWVHTCISINFVLGKASLVVNGHIKISKAKVDLDTEPKFLNMTLESIQLSISTEKVSRPTTL